MRVWLTGLVLIVSGHLFGQSLFADSRRLTDSLNNYYFKKFKDKEQFDDNGLRTGLWIKYELLFDTINSSLPVTIQGPDFSMETEFLNPSTFVKSEENYSSGQINGLCKWYNAIYEPDDSLTWEIIRETEFKDGKKNGIEREYSLGSVYHEVTYVDGKFHGTEIMYWPPPILYLKAQHKNGVAKHATWYYQTGQIKTTKDYGRYPLVKVIEYHENGKVKSRYNAIGDDETIDGVYKSFDENGKLIGKTTFDNGIEVKK